MHPSAPPPATMQAQEHYLAALEQVESHTPSLLALARLALACGDVDSCQVTPSHSKPATALTSMRRAPAQVHAHPDSCGGECRPPVARQAE